MSHNYFDFKFLPQVLNDIINENAQEMVDIQNKEIHRRHFQKTLDVINSLVISYSANMGYGYTIYALDLPFPEECNVFRDNCFIFSWKINNIAQLNNVLMLNEEWEYDIGTEDEFEDDDELIEMEDNDIEME